MMPDRNDDRAKASHGADIRVIARAFEILELFAGRADKLSLMAIVKATGLSKATAFRIVSTLVEDDILRQSECGEYELGFFCMRRANVILATNELVSQFRSSMMSLSAQLGETIVLTERKGDVIIDLDMIAAPTAVVSIPPIGRPSFLHERIIGKAMLAIESICDLQEYCLRHGLPDAQPELIFKDSEGIDECLIQPVTNEQYKVIGALWISNPSYKNFRRSELMNALTTCIADVRLREGG